MQAPLGHKFVQIFYETIVVTAFQNVDHFVDNDVFEANFWLLRQFQIERYALGAGIATAPLCFHLSDLPARHFDTQCLLPFSYQWGDQRPELLSIPM